MPADVDIEDGLIESGSDMSVKLDVFEGPLDLLLFLIRKNELDIYDIPIAEVTRQYMEVLRSMKRLSLDVAGEFFVMAATLMYIKSRMILPSDERIAQAEGDDDDSDIDPRWQLVEQLLEYRKIKQAAESLEDMIDARQNFGDSDVNRCHLFCRNLILRRLAEKLVNGEIRGENTTVSDCMEYILEFPQKTFSFTSLFGGQKASIVRVMATFLAMLELTRLKRLKLEQDAAFGEIYCTKIEDGSLQGGDFDSAASVEESDAGSAGATS